MPPSPPDEPRACALCLTASRDPRCPGCGAAIEAGPYRIEQLLSQTSHSRVYVAVDQADQRVALKEMAFAVAPDARSIEAFAQEAALLQRVSHPGVPKLISAFQVGTGPALRLYVAQELIEGASLLELLNQGTPFSEAQVLQIAESVLSTLEALHSRSPPIIHRDIKPANLIRREDGAIVLVDFVAVQGAPNHSTVGTFGYMAPEQLDGKVDASSDLYALGATLVHLVGGASPEEFLVGHQLVIRGKLKVSLPFEQFLERLLDPEPSKRFPSASDALLALGALTQQEPTRAPSKRSSYLVWGLLGGLAVLSGALMLSEWLRESIEKRALSAEPSPRAASCARWVPWVKGKLPANAQLGGHEPERALFICRANRPDGNYPGKTWPDWFCLYGFNGQEIKSEFFDYLNTEGCAVGWVSVFDGRIPSNAIVGGTTNGQTTYVCRASHGEGEHAGGVHSGRVVGGRCSIGYGAREVLKTSYDVLVEY